ncbi:uncharacterized protein LOC6569524 [Drosophila grimshawi]|uniref:uncharacterized protein LOC6569524 n=1 Tax=Drosophila grimshawi TaxID=7222 RepID=UPI0013EF100B|nr:uncharacterized protein LOC6569524 [Drosophila grimshawi]
MGVIYKILKQQRHQHMDINTATKCKVQAAIRQRQLQRLEEQQQEQHEHDDAIAEQQLQQLCRFLAENAASKKHRQQRLNIKQQYTMEQPLSELHSVATCDTHDMDLLMEHLSTCTESIGPEAIKSTVTSTSTSTSTPTSTTTAVASGAPRDSILLKIRHQIFERKRQRQRQLAELMKQRLVVWRPW